MSGPKADAILARTEPTHKKKKRKLDKSAVVEGGIGVVDEDEFGGWSNNVEDEVDAPGMFHHLHPFHI
jgi:hypothetical protein